MAARPLSVLVVLEKPSALELICVAFPPGLCCFPFRHSLRGVLGSPTTVAVVCTNGYLCENAVPTVRNPFDYFDAGLERVPQQARLGEVRRLRQAVKNADVVIVCPDCDRAGFIIAADVKRVSEDANPRAVFLRAFCSGVSVKEVQLAFTRLVDLDETLAIPALASHEIHLRAGAAFSALNTAGLSPLWGGFRVV